MANRPGSTVVKGRNRLLLDLYQVLLGRQSLRVAQREPPISGCSVSCQPVAGPFWLHAPGSMVHGAWCRDGKGVALPFGQFFNTVGFERGGHGEVSIDINN